MGNMISNSQFPMGINVTIRRRDKRTHKIIEERKGKNRVTKLALLGIVRFLNGEFNNSTMYNQSSYIPRYLALGTNMSTSVNEGVTRLVTINDTKLLSEIKHTDGRSARIWIAERNHCKIESKTEDNYVKLTINCYIQSNLYNKEPISEAGLFTKETGNNCWARIAFEPITKESNEVLDVTWEITVLSVGQTIYPESLLVNNGQNIELSCSRTGYWIHGVKHILEHNSSTGYIIDDSINEQNKYFGETRKISGIVHLKNTYIETDPNDDMRYIINPEKTIITKDDYVYYVDSNNFIYQGSLIYNVTIPSQFGMTYDKIKLRNTDDYTESKDAEFYKYTSITNEKELYFKVSDVESQTNYQDILPIYYQENNIDIKSQFYGKINKSGTIDIYDKYGNKDYISIKVENERSWVIYKKPIPVAFIDKVGRIVNAIHKDSNDIKDYPTTEYTVSTEYSLYHVNHTSDSENTIVRCMTIDGSDSTGHFSRIEGTECYDEEYVKFFESCIIHKMYNTWIISKNLYEDIKDENGDTIENVGNNLVRTRLSDLESHKARDYGLNNYYAISDDGYIIGNYERRKLSYSIQPQAVTDGTITWVSTDESVAIVNSSGVVSAVGPGECMIIGITCNNITDRIKCTVTCASEENITDTEVNN